MKGLNSPFLAAIVEKIPTVPETKDKIEKVDEDHKILDERRRKVNDKFEKRKTEFFSLVASAHQLNGMVNSSSS